MVWSGLDSAWIQAERAWPDLDWDALARNSVSGVTDERGEVRLELPATPRVRSVVWATHPEYLGVGIAADEGRDPPLPQTVRLQERSHLAVRVLGTPAGAQSEVQAHRLLECGDEALAVLDPLARSVRRALRQSMSVDANGRAVLSPLPGEQRVWASCGELHSAPWIGRAPADVELDLRPTFTVGGNVTWDRSARPSLGARITCYAVRGADREVIARTSVRADGSFGDLRLPLVACDSYVVELGADSMTRQYADVFDPKPGEHRTLEFTVHPGSALTVRVLDPDSLGVPGASVSGQWMEGPTWRRMDRRTDSEGTAVLDGIPPAAVWIRVRAAGFVPKLNPQLETDLHDGSPIVVRLSRAGVVEGQCLLAGKPAGDFTVHFWTKKPKDGGKLEVRSSTDGRFRVDEAATGELVLLATGPTSMQSPQVRVLVEEAKPTSAVLELPAPRVAIGRVVDGVTGEPVPSARVALQIRVGDQILRPWKEATRVDAGGAFALSGLVPGPNFLRVTAEGFAARTVDLHVGAEERVDAGAIGLHHDGSIEVQLVGAPGQDFSGIRVDLQGIELRPFTPVPSSGVVCFDGLMPGSYGPRIVFKDNSTRFLLTHVAPGRHVKLVTPVGEEGVEVEVEGATPELAERLYELRVTFLCADGTEGEEYYPIRRGRNVRVRTLDAKRVYLEATDREQAVLGVGRFELTGARGEILHFRVEGRSPVLRIVDRARQPIAGARVGVMGAELESTWARQCSTDGDGLCVLEGVPFESVGISLRHPDHGVTAMQIVELPRDSTQPIELVFDARLALRLQVLDHAASLAGIEFFATDLGRYEDGLGPATSDAVGLATWPSVGAGVYVVNVVHPGVWPDTARVEVKESSQPIPFQVRRLGNVEFRVTTTLGNPVVGARFELHSVERDHSVAQWIEEGAVPAPAQGLRTDEQGRLAVRGLPNGEFRFQALLPNGATLEGTITVPPANTLEHPIRIE
ncbi:MAG: carboxypeptidase regulatory-like domain-containing protein [Planctomycetes bacterium]|nr:carboxypeptidase regulatory-like domain-containing protein [Planctomycetota bacterium]